MFQEAFVKLEGAESAAILAETNPKVDGGALNPETATVLAHDISFYPGYRFLDITDYSVNPPHRRFVVHRPGDVTILDWTNAPIYALNARAPIRLTPETVGEYVAFFFTYVRGRHGRFIVTEAVDDIQWREEPPPAARKAVGKLLQPVTLDKVGPGRNYVLSLCVMFKDSLFRAVATVDGDGMVQLGSEELLIEDMPVMDDTFGQ